PLDLQEAVMFLRRLLREDTGTELEDIIRNLNYILKTKRGVGSFLDSFGMSETGHRTAEEVITSVTSELRENISLYEPRVDIVDIDEDYDEATNHVRLTVECRVKRADEIVVITLDPAGQMVNVTGRLREAPEGHD
ncbi:MAG: GPW/gp25 family protein, partial [Myxococcales bacterium]|nr:GPW/gp25 family protein [Myxococcales bacterium]